MKVCPECGFSNPDNRDFCGECGRNLKAEVIKTNERSPMVNQLFFKLDKKKGEMRVSRTKVISLGIFGFLFLLITAVTSFAPNAALWAVFLVAFLIAALFALIAYAIGYVIAGILEKLDYI